MAAIHRIRRSPEQWQELIAHQRASGLSQAAFCEEQGLALSTFTRWRQRLVAEAPADREAPWIELPAAAPGNSGWEIELELGDGVRLRLRRG